MPAQSQNFMNSLHKLHKIEPPFLPTIRVKMLSAASLPGFAKGDHRASRSHNIC